MEACRTLRRSGSCDEVEHRHRDRRHPRSRSAPRGSRASMRSPAAGCRKAGRPSSAARPAAARRCSRWSSWSRGASDFGEPGRLHRLRGDRRGARRRTSGRWASTSTTWSPGSSWRSTTSRSSASEIEETGEYDLEGLFVRLGHAIDSIGAKRVVLDTIESLFCGFDNAGAPPRRAAPAVPLAQGPGRHRASSPASGAMARSPATGSRSTSPTASSCSTTASSIRSRPGACGSSSTAARRTGRTSIRS